MPDIQEMQRLLNWYTYAKYTATWDFHFKEMDVAMVDGSLGESHFAIPLHKLSREEFEIYKQARAQAYYDIVVANQQGNKDALYQAMFDGHILEYSLLLQFFSDRDDD